MNWLEFLGLVNALQSLLQVSSFQHHQLGSNLREEETVSKSQHKQDKKISAECSQIKDLRTKLDGAIAENTQIWELLNPATLQTAFTNALQAVQSGKDSTFSYSNRSGKFLDKPREPQLVAGKDRTIDPDKSCKYCKHMGHDMDSCLHLQK